MQFPQQYAECFTQVGFGSGEERCGFPEGALLGHMHRYIEARDLPAELDDADGCLICGISLDDTYHGNLALEGRLTIAPTHLDCHARYTAEDSICVCPNCHTALHHLRPWRTAMDCESILKE
ncbi:MAG: hypothetical protein ACI4O7_13080 [Aristaeellaceae bacterium]